MGITQNYVLGRTVRAVIDATTPAQFADETQQAFAAAGTFRVLEGYSVTTDQDRTPRIDARASPGVRQRMPRPVSTNVEFKTYIDMNGTLGPPDVAVMLRMALGDETISSDQYLYEVLNNSVIEAANLLFEGEGIMSQAVYGWVCNKLTFNAPKDNEPTFTFTGPAKKSVEAGRIALSGTVDGSGTPVTVVTAAVAIQALGVELGALVSIGTSTGPHRITARDTSTGNITFTPAVTTNEGTAPDMIPYTPADFAQLADATPDSPANAVQSTLTIFGTSLKYENFTFNVENNIEEIRSAGAETLVDFSRGYRNVTGEVTLYAGQAEILRKTAARTFSNAVANATEGPIVFRMGGTLSGDPFCLITITRAQMDFSSLDVGGPGVAMVTIPFTAMAPVDYSDPDDEITIEFNVV